MGNEGVRSIAAATPVLPPLARHNHIDLTAAAAGVDQPVAPIEHGGPGAVPSRHFGGIRLDLMLAFLAPDDQPDAGGGSIAERHRRAGLGFQRRDRRQPVAIRFTSVSGSCVRLLWVTSTKRCKSDPMMTPPIAPPKISHINEKYTFDHVAIFGASGPPM